MKDTEWIEHLGVLDVKEGDLIVVKVPCNTGWSAMENIREAIDVTVRPRNVAVLIMLDGMDMGVIRRDGGWEDIVIKAEDQ